MDENLIGYMLNALDPDAHRAVERHLEASPDARRKLELLRHALAPLASDKDAVNPPDNLVLNTLKRVVAQRCHPKRIEPNTLPLGPEPVSRSRWRRPDVLIAAAVLLIILFLIPPGLMWVRHLRGLTECANNLKAFHTAFESYARDHNGRLPHPAEKGPLAAAGIYAPALRDGGYWQENMKVVCPRLDCGVQVPIPSLQDLERYSQTSQYYRWLWNMGGCYGFHLGYMDEKNRFRTLETWMGDLMPIMADRSIRLGETAYSSQANSPNHSGVGQNVLFLGGQVQFCVSRFVGDDDIFLNRAGLVAAGIGRADAVLGSSEASPFPTPGSACGE